MKATEIIVGWPYAKITAEINAFRSLFSKEPVSVWVGGSLWALLLTTLGDNEDEHSLEFFVGQDIPVRLERSGILECHEFFVSG